MIRLVDDLLDVSRIARGKVELQRETVVIAEVVSQAIEQMAPALASGHTLEVAIAPGLTTRGDPLRLAQIIANLLGNAIKYTPRTGRIDITGRRDGNDIVLVVRDTGIGIEPDMLPRVFELFVQERKALDRAGGGLGLGLAIVRALVEQHGGTVVARSEGADRGTEVEVRLPASEAAVAGEPAPAAVRGTATAPTRVLLVDDNTDALELLALGLESRGHVVSSAPDGPTALSLASDARPMVAILDIGLPGMDGYELARRLRAEPSTQEIKLIAVTGYGQSSDRLRALAAGFDEHLVKPVTVEAVAVAIGRLQHK
jgi:CheY-like chemotaxis protein